MLQTMTTLRDYLQSTEDALNAGRIDDALEHCQYVLSHFPESLEAHRLLGEIYLAQERLDEARQAFDWVLTSDPENVIAYCNRALISERKGDIDTALDCYQQAYELSKGISQIRQEFNKLSARIGQQGFMFSRAGLARLYMRGDLLFQAHQEWEAVLAASPDRLDARTGLLETCWRENEYEQVEQIAAQLLEDIPSCLKALLLLAHVTSSRNPERAAELLQQAEALDPEMNMAQGLFSDLIAAQPDDPFLAQLKKGPVVLPPPSAQPAAASPSPAADSGAPAAEEHAPIFGWTTPDPYPLTPAAPEPAPIAAEAGESSAPALSAGTWPGYSSLSEEPSETWQAQLEQEPAAAANEAAPPAWLDSLTQAQRGQETGAMPPTPPPTTPMPAPIQPADEPAIEPAPPAMPEAEKKPITAGAKPAPSAHIDDDGDEAERSWPEWLKSLGAEEIRPEQDAQPPITPAPPEPGEAEPEPPRATPRPNPAYWEEPAPAAPSPQADDPWANLGASSAAPAWLDQLQAPGMPQGEASATWLEQLNNMPQPAPAPETQPEPEPPASWSAPAAHEPQPSAFWSPPRPEEPEAANPPLGPIPQPEMHPAWIEQLTPPPDLPEQPEIPDQQQAIKTLEDLEKSLLSQGFVPLEPGKLSAIAHEAEPPAQQEMKAAPSFGSPSSEPEDNREQPANAQDEHAPVAPTAVGPKEHSPEPLWPATPQPQPANVPPPPPAPPFVAPAAAGPSSAPIVPPDAPTIKADPSRLPSYRADALLEDGLETTMKRPVFRLQPMKQQTPPPPPPGRAPQRSKQTANESGSESKPQGDLSYRDRLIRGYQCQLAGAYDEAMQEYRVVIRNQPELLGEVISNTRALLKLAPRYAPGYRVLGDAYMRQGEYLQAMEAYNKALTMAKRAKGQG